MKQSVVFVILLLSLLTTAIPGSSQELYVFSEPASNIPGGSISAKYTAKFLKGYHSGKLEQRHMPELMLGINKALMLKFSGTFSDMYTEKLKGESVKAYAKYRFISVDDVHKHFRMAAFAEGSYSRNDPFYQELSFDGDQSGIQAGLIVTQLWNKLAVSSTLGYMRVLADEKKNTGFPEKAFNYSISAGYLILPLSYTDYRQTNLNFYLELLGQNTLDKKQYFIDIAPAAQLIFNSNTKINLGYRIQIESDMHRMAQNRWQISLERTFLKALRR